MVFLSPGNSLAQFLPPAPVTPAGDDPVPAIGAGLTRAAKHSNLG